jgi:hypothetical protein
MNSLKSLAINCGPLSEMTRGLTPGYLVLEKFASPDYLDGRNGKTGRCGSLIGPKMFFGVLCKPFKRMAGTTRLELATSAVTDNNNM